MDHRHNTHHRRRPPRHLSTPGVRGTGLLIPHDGHLTVANVQLAHSLARERKSPANKHFRCGLENRYPSLGGSRVQIPPPPLNQAVRRPVAGTQAAAGCFLTAAVDSWESIVVPGSPPSLRVTGARTAHQVRAVRRRIRRRRSRLGGWSNLLGRRRAGGVLATKSIPCRQHHRIGPP
jgi:hypothetical protein